MLSYSKNCANIGASSINKKLSFRSFQCVNNSFRQTMLGMVSPKPKKWAFSSEFKEDDFIDECQGVANDGEHWYFTSNGDNDRQGIYQYSRSMVSMKKLIFSGNNEMRRVSNFPIKDGSPFLDHIGDPDCFQGKIYIPVQNPHGFLVMDTSLKVSSLSWHPTSKEGDSHPWCAINPWNEKLYTSDFTNDNIDTRHYELTLMAYNKETFKRESEFDLPLKVPTLRVQGGCFSENGHLFLSSDAKLKSKITKLLTPRLPVHLKRIMQSQIPIEPCISMYSIVNGHYFGFVPIKRKLGILDRQEVEGITYWPQLNGGVPTNLHVVLLGNDLDTDGVFFKHFSPPTGL